MSPHVPTGANLKISLDWIETNFRNAQTIFQYAVSG